LPERRSSVSITSVRVVDEVNVPCRCAGPEALTEGGDTGLAVGREAGKGRQGGEPEPDGARRLSEVAHGRRGDGTRGGGGDGRGHGRWCLRSEYNLATTCALSVRPRLITAGRSVGRRAAAAGG
jgi:hypothetical protein